MKKSPETSDRNLEVQLTTQRGFSPDGARRVIKSYRDSLAFADPGGQGYDSAVSEAGSSDGIPVDETPDDGGARWEPPPQRVRRVESSDVMYSWPLEDADKVEVNFVGNVGKKSTRRDLEAVIDYLGLIKKRTPEPEPAGLRSPGGGLALPRQTRGAA